MRRPVPGFAFVSIAQWIERSPPKAEIEVRLPVEAQSGIRMATKKRSAKKPKKKTAPKEKPIRKTQGKLVGRVIHYYDKIKVAVVKFSAPVKKSDTVRFEGGGKSFSQALASIEKDHKKVAAVKKRQEVGVKVAKQVREGYRVYRN